MTEKSVAVVLSAGSGRRMNSETAKQYLPLKGKPIICYCLQAFEDCPFMGEVILVAGEKDLDWCRTEIVERYHFSKVSQIVAGGHERYDSVYNGLKAVASGGGCDYVYIHDGARPFVSQDILKRAREAVAAEGACVVGMPVKDTIKISDEQGFCAQTPRRSLLWQVQTPQVFRYPLVMRAYEKLMENPDVKEGLAVTDDAMVVEQMIKHKVKLVEGSYSNMKITTPEDLKIAEALL